ncbi:MAG: helix-turn-helix domain-containing protein [Acutalibacteraceae bacterium]
MDKIIEIFGKRIKSYRQKNRLSQEKLAELCGLHTTYIGQLERGEKNPSLLSIIKISNALNISSEELIRGLSNVDYINQESIAQKAYDFFNQLNTHDAEILFEIIEKIYLYKNE